MSQYNIPDNYDALVNDGECQYTILGVETRNNMDSMERFIEAVPGLADKIEVDEGTQIVVTHPDPVKVIVIDAGGLGDFYDSGFDVTVVDRSSTKLPVPEWLTTHIMKKRLNDAAPDLLSALVAAADMAWVETRDVKFDHTIMFGHGGIDFDALDCCRQEIHSRAGSFMVWPSQIGGNAKWSVYGGPHGIMWFERFTTEAEAKDCAVKELATICPDHPAVIARAAIAKAKGETK